MVLFGGAQPVTAEDVRATVRIDPVRVSVSIPRAAHRVGQPMNIHVDVANAGPARIDVLRITVLTAAELAVEREPAGLPRTLLGGAWRRFVVGVRPASEGSYVVLARVEWRADDGTVSTSDSTALVFDVTGSPRRLKGVEESGLDWLGFGN